MNYLSVDLYQDFQCIADSCPEDCCHGWTVNIDKDTYQKMVENEDKLEIPASDWLFEKDGGYQVKLNPDGRCPMLDEHNLCRVVRKLGPEYLSHVCTVYPRMHMKYGGVIEGYLTLSCSHVVSMLMEKEMLEFDFTENHDPVPDYPHTELYLFESAVRTSMVMLIQGKPDILLSTRLFTAFTILEDAIRMQQNSEMDASLLQKNIDACTQDAILYALEDTLIGSIDEQKRYRLWAPLLDCLNIHSKTDTFGQIVWQAKEYFQQNTFEQYLSDMQEFLNAAYPVYSNFYTNYWIYRIFSDTLSIPEYEKSKEKFLYIAIEFAINQILCFTSCMKKQRLDREEYIYIISSLSRIMEHNAAFQKALVEQIKENNLASAAGVLMLTIV